MLMSGLPTTPCFVTARPRPQIALPQPARRRCWHPHALPPDNPDTPTAAASAALSQQQCNTAAASNHGAGPNENKPGRSRQGAHESQERKLAALGKHSYRIVLAYDGTRFQVCVKLQHALHSHRLCACTCVCVGVPSTAACHQHSWLVPRRCRSSFKRHGMAHDRCVVKRPCPACKPYPVASGGLRTTVMAPSRIQTAPCTISHIHMQGWQLQRDAPTVQWEVERALGRVLGEERSRLGVQAAGRTDAGVHASGQCVQFWT